MSITSTKAFADIQVKLPDRRREVYKAIAENPNSSIYDIADVLGWNLNQVSNRKQVQKYTESLKGICFLLSLTRRR